MRVRGAIAFAVLGGMTLAVTACTGTAPSAETPQTTHSAPATEQDAQSRRDGGTPSGTPTAGQDAQSRRDGGTPSGTPTAAEPPARTRVTIVGDIMLGRRVGQASAARGDVSAPLRPLQQRLAAADLTVGNLESTLSRAGAPRQGDDSFGADPAVLDGLDDAGFDVVSLANNHTGDFGPRALRHTLRRLARSPIESVGAGRDRAQAWHPVVVERNGVRFGFVAFNAIGETPRATRTSPGAAEVRMPPRTGPLDRGDLHRLTQQVRRLDGGRADVVIALPHWGDQYTHTPVPAQRRVGRALVDAGADIVVGGHPHWVQRVQSYRGRLIVHSLGNFVFDMDFSTQTQQGVFADLVFVGEELRSVRFTPYVIGDDFAPRVVRGPRAETILAPLGVPARVRLNR